MCRRVYLSIDWNAHTYKVFEGAVWFRKINNSRDQFYEWATAEIKSLTFILKSASRSSEVLKTVLFLSFLKKGELSI